MTIRSVAFAAANGASVEMPVTPKPRLIDAAPMPDRPAVTAISAAPKAGNFITAFSYSGPAANVHVATGAAESFPVYVDSGDSLPTLPPELSGADYIQAAVADKSYSAVDLMEFSVKPGSTVYLAHDDRLPLPSWLTQQFQPSKLSVKIAGHAMQVFEHRADRAESLTLGSNSETAGAGNMYVVFVK